MLGQDPKIQQTGGETEGIKYKLFRGVMQHRCGDTIREQVNTDRVGAGQTGPRNTHIGE